MLVVLISEENRLRKIRLPEPWRGEQVLPYANPNPYAYNDICGYISNSGMTYNKCFLYRPGAGAIRELHGNVIVGKLLYKNTIVKRKVFRYYRRELLIGKMIANTIGKQVIIQINNMGPHIWEAPRVVPIPAKFTGNHYNLLIYELEMPDWLAERLWREEDKAKEEVLLISKHVIHPAPFVPYKMAFGTSRSKTEYAIIAVSRYTTTEKLAVVHPEHEKASITLPPGFYLLVHRSRYGGVEEDEEVD